MRFTIGHGMRGGVGRDDSATLASRNPQAVIGRHHPQNEHVRHNDQCQRDSSALRDLPSLTLTRLAGYSKKSNGETLAETPILQMLGIAPILCLSVSIY